MTEGSLIGVLLLNLGGPDSIRAVRPFLYNLFSDREIIRLGPSFLQRPLAWFISAMRAGKSRQMYGFIGGRSPINEITMAQAEALDKALNENSEVRSQKLEVKNSLLSTLYPLRFKVYIGMRYWHPFIEDAVQKILQDRVDELIVLSLYPHYSKTTTASAISEFKRAMKRVTVNGSRLTVRYIESWYDFPPYIDALTKMIYKGISGFEVQDVVLLYSAHGLPLSFVREGDPYPEHIRSTIELTNKRLTEEPYNIKNLDWRLAYQSRIGRKHWLEPSTEETIIRLASEGHKNILTVPVSFVSDNIETLYEIGIYYRDIAIKHGVNLRRCPSLNTSKEFIEALKGLVMQTITK